MDEPDSTEGATEEAKPAPLGGCPIVKGNKVYPKTRNSRGVFVSEVDAAIQETVDEIGDADTQLDDMRWAYKSRNDARPSTPGQKRCQKMMRENLEKFMAQKTQLEIKTAQLGEARLVGRRDKKRAEGELAEVELAEGEADKLVAEGIRRILEGK